jgi:hypothetical protein
MKTYLIGILIFKLLTSFLTKQNNQLQFVAQNDLLKRKRMVAGIL